MADTRTLTRVLFHVERAGGKTLLVGDPAQLSAVGAGGLFAAIAERNGAIELRDNRRQRDELERRALARLREGSTLDYLAHAAAQGRLSVADTRVEAKAQLVADWWQAARSDVADNVMIAYRRSDVAELNAVARAILEHEGRLGDERLTLADGAEIAVGDRVLCTRNDRGLDVANGSRGTVAAVDPAERMAAIELDDGRRVALPRCYLDRGHLVHAYALTGHKTQGLTVERAFVLADDRRALREWGYVALSRAREATRVYTIANDVEPDAPPHRPEPAGPVDRLAEALARPAAQTLALDAAGRAGTLRTLIAEKGALDDRRDRIASERRRAAQELENLGLLGRVRHRRPLQETVRRHDEQLRSIDDELERKDREIEVARERVFSDARSRRQARSRALERGRGVGRGLEL
jgi:ATP-dependent exoDNAse (exonuclease V) alpha subunit